MSQLADRPDGVLGLPAPVVPEVVRHVIPLGMATRLTGRLFLIEAADVGWELPRFEPGALFGFTHNVGVTSKAVRKPPTPPSGVG
jgi:hypothetical protein